MGRAELTAVLLRQAPWAENLGIEKGLEGIQGVVMLGHQGFHEALEKRGPVQDSPGVLTASESTGEHCQFKLEDSWPGALTPCLCPGTLRPLGPYISCTSPVPAPPLPTPAIASGSRACRVTTSLHETRRWPGGPVEIPCE